MILWNNFGLIKWGKIELIMCPVEHVNYSFCWLPDAILSLALHFGFLNEFKFKFEKNNIFFCFIHDRKQINEEKIRAADRIYFSFSNFCFHIFDEKRKLSLINNGFSSWVVIIVNRASKLNQLILSYGSFLLY